MCRLSACCNGEIIDTIGGGSMCCECNQLCEVRDFKAEKTDKILHPFYTDTDQELREK